MHSKNNNSSRVINRPLDMEWLEDFLTLSKAQNFSRAAELRAIAQPAFSRHIRSLEEWVGVDLIDRSVHPVGLTVAGKKFLPYLEDIISTLEAARIKARVAQERGSKTLSFALTHSLSLNFFPHLLSEMDNHFRLGSLQTMSDTFTACEAIMLQRRVQFLICYGHHKVSTRLDDDNYPVVILSEDVLVPVCTPTQDGKPRFNFDLEKNFPILSYSENSILGRILNAELKDLLGSKFDKKLASTVDTVFTASNASLIRAMVLQDKGVAWLPKALIEDDLTLKRLVKCGQDIWQIPVEIKLYRQRTEMSEMAETLWHNILSSHQNAAI
jgi:DNA-binding transcriptional LysR family regulator